MRNFGGDRKLVFCAGVGLKRVKSQNDVETVCTWANFPTALSEKFLPFF